MGTFIALASAIGLGMYIGRMQKEAALWKVLAKTRLGVPKEDHQATKSPKNIINNPHRHVPLDGTLFETRLNAESCLSHLRLKIIDYGVTTVFDLYSLIGKPTTFMDHSYGWTDLCDAKITTTHHGYVLFLPPAKYVG